MKRTSILAATMAAAALLTIATGCQTTKEKQAVQQKESLLLTAGFKAIPVTTPEQEQEMRILPSQRISAIRRMGKVYLVYPDPDRKTLYVGSNAEYLAYEALAQQRGLEPSDWTAAWGDWDAR